MLNHLRPLGEIEYNEDDHNHIKHLMWILRIFFFIVSLGLIILLFFI